MLCTGLILHLCPGPANVREKDPLELTWPSSTNSSLGSSSPHRNWGRKHPRIVIRKRARKKTSSSGTVRRLFLSVADGQYL